MEWIIDNWYIVLALIVICIAIIVAIINYFRLPSDKQIEALREWLKYAVTLAEQELGSKTGQLKLRYVYDLAISTFPWIVKLVPFDQFSMYVDEALAWLNNQLTSNEAVKTLVKGE